MLEPLSHQCPPQDYEMTLFQALVNEGSYEKILSSKRPQFFYSEKQLRDAAASEVAAIAAVPSSQADDAEKGSRKRKVLNPDEKAKKNRDRNREHAKNTRLRKKAYIMKLKELVDQMTRQRDIDEKDRRMLGEKVYDSQVIRKNAVRVFLHYRATNESNKEKWQTILDENVTFSQPITPYRSFNYGEIINSSRVIRGIDAMINDTASLGLMVETIGHGSEQWSNAIKSGRSSRVTISTGKDDMMVAGDIVMCRYIMKIEGTELTTPQSVCTQHGMMQCRFNKQNKITAIEIMFDVMGFMQQLQRASSSSPECCISPNTLDMALQPSMEARSLIKAVGDFCVMHVNEAWTQLTGTVQSEAEGKRFLDVCGVVYLQREQLYKLCLDATTGKAGSLVIVAFHKRPSPVNAVSTTFSHSHQTTSMGDVALSYIKLLPLTADSNKISHLLCVQTPLHLTPTEKANLTSKFVNGGPFQPCSMHANSASAAGAGASAAGVGAGASAGASAASSSSKMSTDGYDSSTIAAQEVFNMMDSSCMQPPPSSFDNGQNVGELYFNMSNHGIDMVGDMGDMLQNLFEEE